MRGCRAGANRARTKPTWEPPKVGPTIQAIIVQKKENKRVNENMRQRVTADRLCCYNTQQHTTTHNNTQQHTTTHNNTQQHTTTTQQLHNNCTTTAQQPHNNTTTQNNTTFNMNNTHDTHTTHTTHIQHTRHTHDHSLPDRVPSQLRSGTQLQKMAGTCLRRTSVAWLFCGLCCSSARLAAPVDVPMALWRIR